jgi:hypothetical protein
VIALVYYSTVQQQSELYIFLLDARVSVVSFWVWLRLLSGAFKVGFFQKTTAVHGRGVDPAFALLLDSPLSLPLNLNAVI